MNDSQVNQSISDFLVTETLLCCLEGDYSGKNGLLIDFFSKGKIVKYVPGKVIIGERNTIKSNGINCSYEQSICWILVEK